MAQKTTGVWGIDLGQCALKAVRIEQVDGEVVATAFDYVEHPKLLNQPDAEPDQMIREALQKFLSRNTLSGDIIAISVPSQSGLARFVKLPPVEEKKIADIVRFEAKQQIPFSLDEVVWDYQKIGAGTVTDGFAMDTEIGLFAMKRDKVASYLDHFRDVGVDVHIVQMSPLALCNFVAFDLLRKVGTGGEQEESSGKKQCVVALDIGTDSSNLVVTDGQRIIWQRPIPLGGNHFTRALTKEPFKLTFAKAEHLKRNATKSGPELKKILTALKPVLNDFVQEVQRSLGYFTNTHRDAQVEYVMGLGNAFRLPGFQRFLAEKLQLDVRKLSKLERASGDGVVQAPVFTENILAFAVAYGLALQGLSLARLQTNLLPPEIRMDRLIKAKKPWAVAAAAALLLGASGLLIGKGKAYNEYNPENAELSKAIAEAKSVVDEKTAKDRAVDKKNDEVNKVINELKVFGGLRQEDWIMVNKLIDDSLPRPVIATGKDGKIDVVSVSPICKPALEKYWTPQIPAAEAQTDFFRAQLEGKPIKDVSRDFKARKLEDVKARDPKNPTPEKLLKPTDFLEANLFLFSIETINARYTKDLGTVWTNAATFNQKHAPQEAKGAQWTQGGDPKREPGWVIVLRGYTYHYDKTKFVISVLGNNLAATFGIPQQFLDVADRPKDAAGAGSGVRAGSGATAAASRSPAGSAAASSATAADGSKAPADHPVLGKVHQLILLTTSDKNNPDPVPKDLNNVLNFLVKEAPAPSSGKGSKSSGSKSSQAAGIDLFADDGSSAMGGGVQGITGKGKGSSAARGNAGGGMVTKEGTVPLQKFNRAIPEGTIQTEFIFVILWKGPAPEDFSLPSASGSPAGARGRGK
jgi:type IV pilus assembly protein PilM